MVFVCDANSLAANGRAKLEVGGAFCSRPKKETPGTTLNRGRMPPWKELRDEQATKNGIRKVIRKVMYAVETGKATMEGGIQHEQKMLEYDK